MVLWQLRRCEKSRSWDAWYPQEAFAERRNGVGITVMSSQPREAQHVLVASMKVAAAALRDAEIEFMLAAGSPRGRGVGLQPNFQPVIELARALREQIDWEFVRSHTAESPFARAFLTLVEGLGIVEPEGSVAA